MAVYPWQHVVGYLAVKWGASSYTLVEKKDKAQDRRDKILECKGYRRTPGFSLMVWCVFQYTVINY